MPWPTTAGGRETWGRTSPRETAQGLERRLWVKALLFPRTWFDCQHPRGGSPVTPVEGHLTAVGTRHALGIQTYVQTSVHTVPPRNSKHLSYCPVGKFWEEVKDRVLSVMHAVFHPVKLFDSPCWLEVGWFQLEHGETRSEEHVLSRNPNWFCSTLCLPKQNVSP